MNNLDVRYQSSVQLKLRSYNLYILIYNQMNIDVMPKWIFKYNHITSKKKIGV